MFKRQRRPEWVDVSPRCSFCAKPKHAVEKVIGGPGVCICNECIVRCRDILEKADTPRR